MKLTKGFILRVSGEHLKRVLGITEDVNIQKIVNSNSRDYTFDIICIGNDGWFTGEGQDFPRGENK